MSPLLESCRAVSQRAAQMLKWAELGGQGPLLDIALDHLTLGRATLYAAILEQSEIQGSKFEIEAAVSGLRRASQQQYLPLGLLTRAWLRSLAARSASSESAQLTGAESAQGDLDEAWEIAERGPMKLFMADIHLYRARLFGGMRDEGGGMKYPWDKNQDGTSRGPQDDLDAAEKLINECGYHRRDEELAAAKAAAVNW